MLRHSLAALFAAWAAASVAAAPGLAKVNLIEALPTPTPPPLPGLERTLAPVSGSFLFYEDFERGAARWELRGSGPLAWRLLKAKTCGGEYTMHLGGPEMAPVAIRPAESWVTLKPAIDLRKAKRPVLKFDVRGQAAPFEAVSYQAELRVGQGPWQAVGPVVDGRFPLMRSIYLDLAPYAGKQVSLRFYGRFKAGQAPSKGLFLDDLQVIDALPR